MIRGRLAARIVNVFAMPRAPGAVTVAGAVASIVHVRVALARRRPSPTVTVRA